MVIETSRIILRAWQESDAEDLYEHASNPTVGPAAGWPVHRSVEISRQVILSVLSDPGMFAVTLKGQNRVIGNIGLRIGRKSKLGIHDDEAEIEYWIAESYWGLGLIPEALLEIMRYAFEQIDLNILWSGYFEGNNRSKRVQEKCGFRFHHTEKDKEWPLIHAVKTQHIMCITKEEWRVYLT